MPQNRKVAFKAKEAYESGTVIWVAFREAGGKGDAITAIVILCASVNVFEGVQSRNRQKECLKLGSNQRPSDLQSDALPTEL